MSGIYIHIPFCNQACHYCNFHFSTSLNNKDAFLVALTKEISLRSSYLDDEPVSTIYFGGGTPSLLAASEIDHIIDELSRFHNIEPKAEITLEANPEDINKKGYLSDLAASKVNRLSIGVQSFCDEDLRFMNRIHDGEEAGLALRNSLEAGFENLSVDLIYGTPTLSDAQWADNIEKVISLGIPHISMYCLTVEPKTPLFDQIKKGKVQDVDDERANGHFQIAAKQLENNKYVHYEISNFCKEGFMAAHNSNYWKGKDYLGLGPSAHSYNQHSRSWNAANNNEYIAKLNAGELPLTQEDLSVADQYNDYVMLSLRTIWGLSLEYVLESFGDEFVTHCKQEMLPHISSGRIVISDAAYTLTGQGKLFADQIAADLFIVE
ncbi:MAG TPA: radical SAM family heme chaperone HemW [Flavobacteriales bacterium]|nr:radical SAM family heme chaperone HemW [Flavobacteriales bacterium]